MKKDEKYTAHSCEQNDSLTGLKGRYFKIVWRELEAPAGADGAPKRGYYLAFSRKPLKSGGDLDITWQNATELINVTKAVRGGTARETPSCFTPEQLDAMRSGAVLDLKKEVEFKSYLARTSEDSDLEVRYMDFGKFVTSRSGWERIYYFG